MIRLRIPADRRDRHRRAGHWRDRFVDGFVAEAARVRPDTVAVVDGARTLTYRELEHSVQAVAAGLAELGVRRGEVVSWQLPNWYEAVVLHHAVLRLGAVSNPIIPIYRQREVRYILAQAESRVVVVPGTFRGFDYPDMVAQLRPQLPDLRHVVVARSTDEAALPFEDLLGGDPGSLPPVTRGADDAILLMFTSGTTADPKGVLHTHNTLDYENRSIIEVYDLGADDVVFMPSPITHITGLLYGLQLPAMLGTRVVLQDIWEPTAALRLIETEGCSFTVAATPFLHGLVHHPELASFDVTSLRVFACGGADVPPALIRQAGDLLGCTATRVYGSTEFPTLSTSPPHAPEDRRAETDGRAIAPAEFRIVDEADKDVPVGEVGELLVRGPELFPHYLRDADNDGAFTADGWFRTGDLAAADAGGYIAIRGRKKDIVLRGGENISVIEVENLLFEHPAVREVAIVAMPDPVMVERACAFVVPVPGATPTLDELVAFLLGKQLAKQKLPERLEIVAELPKTQSGKVQKFRLREHVQERLKAAGEHPAPGVNR
ncbi:AMP-binding protein [Streptosporangium sp. NBC_01755]|uniref:AMP-binding protein n=1 Tax=unclassified Streptosporangium TaxID=2632669 RepID=UPI002DDC3C6D|nr:MULTISPECIES: AMP-binding protein [unclassified Streptosporangium]WSA24637.1 AMP-binding protein [Streptosporangium sp. NBC_01810]WSC97287.1 AMP-binding protein [Streptosporangium sp. NBC_01755]